jgi:hypothetical protein
MDEPRPFDHFATGTFGRVEIANLNRTLCGPLKDNPTMEQNPLNDAEAKELATA